MGESLGSRPEELYAEHKSNAERLDEMQRRLDAARVLSDILTPEQIQQLGSADFDAKMQHENTLKEATRHYEENSEAYKESASEEMEQEMQNREIERLKDTVDWWNGYVQSHHDKRGGLMRILKWNFDKIQHSDLVAQILAGAKEMPNASKESPGMNMYISLAGLSPQERNTLREQFPLINILPEDEEQSQNPH